MRLQPLGTHRNAVKVGQALPFSISDPTGRLLLARGQVISSIEQFDGLLERGALVDTSHLDDAAQKIAAARPQDLPALWDNSMAQVGGMLRAGNPAEPTVYRRGDEAEAEPALPGWRMQVDDLFAPRAR